MASALGTRSSCLPFQLLRIETFSSLPNDQNDRRNLARQGQTSQRRLHPFGQQSAVEISERSSRGTGHRGRTLEQILQIMIMVGIESAQDRELLGPLEFASGEADSPLIRVCNPRPL